MSEIKVGDVVRLKSGGNPMTVERIDEYIGAEHKLNAQCVWFDEGGEVRRGRFLIIALRLVASKEVL